MSETNVTRTKRRRQLSVEITWDPPNPAGRDLLEGTTKQETKWEPPHWREQLENIREMRRKKDAPVDMVGAAELAAKDLPPEVKLYIYIYYIHVHVELRRAHGATT